MPTRYDNMNRPDPNRQLQGGSGNSGRASTPPQSSRESSGRSQVSRRESGAGSPRPQIKKSQSLENAKQQAYVTRQYTHPSNYPPARTENDMHSRGYSSAGGYPQSRDAQQNRYGSNPQNQQNYRYEQQNRNGSQMTRQNYDQRSTVSGGNRKPLSPSRRKRRLISLGIFAILIIGLFAFWMSRYYQPVIVPGVHINNIDMSGKTKQQAIQLLEAQLEEMRDSIHVTLKYADRTWFLNREDFSVEAPVEHTVNTAMQVAREGNVFKRMADGWTARRNKPHFETAISISDAGMGERIEAIAAELDVPAVNATMTFNASSADFTIIEGTSGHEMDQERVKEAVLQALNDGYVVNTIEFGLETTEPSVKKADLAKATSRISFFETEVNGSQNRIDNVRLALSQFNGMVIAPGESVSFNETTGERSAENGYKEAPGINADKGLEDTSGGGVCQASTTLYNAVLMANCSIDERHRHSFPSSYVKEGFDAMVNWVTDDDLRFTNTSDMPIFIRTYVGKHDDGETYAQVWVYGKKLENGITLSRKSVIANETEKPEPELIKDKDGRYADYVIYDDEAYVAVASRKGMTVEAYLVTKDSSGNVIEEELLHKDYFSAITGKHYYGTQKRPDDVPKTVKSGCYLLKTEEEESESPD